MPVFPTRENVCLYPVFPFALKSSYIFTTPDSAFNAPNQPPIMLEKRHLLFEVFNGGL